MRSRTHFPRAALPFLIVALAACGDDDGVIVGPDAPPPVQTVYEYDLTITLDQVQASSVQACDGKDIFGTVLAGEFHYRVELTGSNQQPVSMESMNYGKVYGRAYSLSPKSTIDLGNRVWRFTNLDQSQVATLTFRGSEWDLTAKDSSLNDASGVAEMKMQSALVGKDRRSIQVGNETTCGLRLDYDYELVRREIVVG